MRTSEEIFTCDEFELPDCDGFFIIKGVFNTYFGSCEFTRETQFNAQTRLFNTRNIHVSSRVVGLFFEQIKIIVLASSVASELWPEESIFMLLEL